MGRPEQELKKRLDFLIIKRRLREGLRGGLREQGKRRWG